MKRPVSFYSEGFKLDGDVKKLVVLKGYGHYQVYAEPAFSEVMRATVGWYREHLPAKV